MRTPSVMIDNCLSNTRMVATGSAKNFFPSSFDYGKSLLIKLCCFFTHVFRYSAYLTRWLFLDALSWKDSWKFDWFSLKFEVRFKINLSKTNVNSSKSLINLHEIVRNTLQILLKLGWFSSILSKWMRYALQFNWLF